MNNTSMIPCFDAALHHQKYSQKHHQHWKNQLANGIRSKQELLKFLSLDSTSLTNQPDASSLFPTRVPLSFANRMQPRKMDDPLLLQVLAQAEEFVEKEGFNSDPLQEHSQQGPLLHKYSSRVLLMLTGACAINCRYCFRREFPYQDFQAKLADIDKILDYLIQHPEVNEFILSGGDPLIVDDDYLEKFLKPIAALPQIKRIRIHSRIPIVLPARITESFKKLLLSLNLPIILVIHTNHPQEINKEVQEALRYLNSNSITLLNQSVLLKGINDDATILARLSEALFESGVLPYYLHQLDQVTGTHHFKVSTKRARFLMHSLLELLPGFLVPTLVNEIAGRKSKTPLDLHISG